MLLWGFIYGFIHLNNTENKAPASKNESTHATRTITGNIARRRSLPHYVMCRAAYGGAGDSAESCWGEFLVISWL